MSQSRTAIHARGKTYVDKLFSTGAAAKQAIAQYGRENVIDASVGAITDDNGMLICLPTVEQLLREMPIQELTAYAPVGGLPGFSKAAIKHTFGNFQPDGYVRAVASAGGAGAISNIMWNYSNVGDTILTHDWYWTPYNMICKETGRLLETFSLFDEKMKFNLGSFSHKIRSILKKQDNLVIILNSPNHNPTGYSISDSEWDGIKDIILEEAGDFAKTITLLLDIAYIDYTNDSVASRAFMKKLGGLPANVIVALAFSMSKGFTVYGQRAGALIGISADQDVIEEFMDVNLVTSRARWSNVNRGCMSLLANIYEDREGIKGALLKKIDAERRECIDLIAKRSEVFIMEAAKTSLKTLPYLSGFFITVPCEKPDEVSDLLKKENIFVAPLAKGIRVAACSVPALQMYGLAAKIKSALTSVDAGN